MAVNITRVASFANDPSFTVRWSFAPARKRSVLFKQLGVMQLDWPAMAFAAVYRHNEKAFKGLFTVFVDKPVTADTDMVFNKNGPWCLGNGVDHIEKGMDPVEVFWNTAFDNVGSRELTRVAWQQWMGPTHDRAETVEHAEQYMLAYFKFMLKTPS